MKFRDVAGANGVDAREEAVRSLVSSMSLDEKIGLMAGSDGLRSAVRPYGAATFDAGGIKRIGVPPIRFTDGPRGVMLGRSTCFPATVCRGATWDVELEERVGEAIGAEAAAHGANLYGGVCMNIVRHPAWGRAQESPGEDPAHVGGMALALMRGAQKHVMACVKHFAANSIENSRFYVDVRMGERALREVYLPHFKRCVDAGAASVMGAYNRLNGEHCCHSRRLLTEILKDEWGFDGFVVSDFMMGLRGADAADGGLDVEMPWRVFFGGLLKARVRMGRTPADRIDDAAARIVRQLARFAPQMENRPPESVIACEAHRMLARESARRGMVLLKNEGGLLPLGRGTKNIAVIGALAAADNTGDTGSSIVMPPYVLTPFEGIRAAAGARAEVFHEEAKSISRAEAAAARADVAVVVVGLTPKDEGEFIPLANPVGDRPGLGLHARDVKLIRAVAASNPACVVVLVGGGALAIDSWAAHVPAVLMAWYPGMEGGNAIADVLFGKAEPGGRLPVMFPREGQKLPEFDRWALSARYDLFHGYRFADRAGQAPAYPFGFGLGYTTFEYSKLTVTPKKPEAGEPVKVRFSVTNTGRRAGSEVAQLYVSYPQSAVERPARELKAFRRVEAKPGETVRVELVLDTRDLAYFDEPSGGWSIERTPYRLSVGSAAADALLPLSAELKVT